MPRVPFLSQVREKNDKFQQRTLQSMFDGQRTSAAAAAADSSADMDMEVRYTLPNTMIASLDCASRFSRSQVDFVLLAVHAIYYLHIPLEIFIPVSKPVSKVSKPYNETKYLYVNGIYHVVRVRLVPANKYVCSSVRETKP